ncbi:mini-circle protein [Streptomyces agglomeratus]|uniref:DinB family protein n=1 Tax=Streptomyces agglomeratus TaxID=285458 RepID=UPI00086951BD|nr:DinB family protein [Streptomyces agglomeratus]OEJ59606.1 mini-circle protein [Streptomyces agglomeratus]
MTRTDMPPTPDERASLVTFLDYVRDTARAKCDDVSPEDARRAPLPGSPLMTLCGLISHLHWVEYYWFQVVFLGEEDQGPWTEEDPDREMRIALDVPLADLLSAYEAQCARYRELVAANDLDTEAKRARDGRRPVNLRWILLHLIGETARHNGHLDILRELADGRTGS